MQNKLKILKERIERIINNKDVTLFWKTQDLYYIKTEEEDKKRKRKFNVADFSFMN